MSEVSQGKLLLVDGNAIMHRAFHALPGLTDRSGELVNAVYGFFSMFLNVIKDFQPTHVIVCFDVGKPTFRQTMYAGYHEKRPPMQDGLIPQMKKVRDTLEQMHVAVFSVAGYEADDVIGTLSVQAAKHLDVVILTGDRDLLQLVNDRVRIIMPIVGVRNILIFDSAKVKEKYGVTPEQFIDYKALIGDQSDNYPGVTGIGPKTAVKLLQEFGTFENLYTNLGNVPPKYAEKLAIDAEQAALAKKLAAIVLDVPVTLKLDECTRATFDLDGLRKSFETFGFQSLLRRYEADFKARERKKEVIEEADPNEQLGLL